MSKHRQDTDKGQMPLPTPRSPRALDEKILAHARAHTPPKRSSFHMGWTGGMATAAMLVVAVYLTNISDTGKEPPPVLKEERAAESAGVASPMSVPTTAKRKTSDQADFDAVEAAPAEQEELQMAPAADIAASRALMRESKVVDTSSPNIPETLDHLETLLESGEIESARRGYAELRNACSECGLPDTLEQALAARQR